MNEVEVVQDAKQHALPVREEEHSLQGETRVGEDVLKASRTRTARRVLKTTAPPSRALALLVRLRATALPLYQDRFIQTLMERNFGTGL